MMDKNEIVQTVEGWFADRIRGGAIARHTDAYNQVFEAKENLIKRLHSLLPKEVEASENEPED